MTLAETLAARLGGEAVAEEAFGIVTVDVPVVSWMEAAGSLRDEPDLAFSWFDFLTAYDDLEQGFAVVVHVWSTAHHQQVVLRTHVARDDARLPTLTGVWRGANWHERETFEMFGIVFEGHPNLVPLLLPDGFEGHPLRKDFVLASRAMKEWPGAKEPGESHGDAPARRRMRPPGQPDPDEWGPEAVPPGERAPTVTAPPEEPS